MSRHIPFQSSRGLVALLAGGVSLAAAACGEAPEPARSAAVATSTPVPRPPSPSDSLCPRDGQWRSCHLEDRINKAGMGIKVMDTISVPYFAERGVRYRIGKTAKLVAYYFPDSAAAEQATNGLHAQRLTPDGDTLGAWPSAPLETIRSANLVAVLFEVNAAQAERVRLAITAGAPQPYTEQAQMLPPAQAK